MLVDGRKIAEEIGEKLKAEVGKLAQPPVLVAFQIGKNPASASFLAIKKRFAERIGAVLELAELPEDFSTEAVIGRIETATRDPFVNGIIIQLPLSETLDIEKILAAIPAEKDPDALSPNPKVLAPVVAAIEEIFKRYKIEFADKKVLVIGEGRLVGKPVIKWFQSKGVNPEIINEFTLNLNPYTLNADIIISGAGKSGLITPEKIKAGIILIDAGTSESNGKLAGDIDPRCAEKASLFTPVPGGLGPIVVAKLFENLLILAQRQKNS